MFRPRPLGLIRYAAAAGFPNAQQRARLAGLTGEEIWLLGSRWYHDYSPLGFKTRQGREVMRHNQTSKQRPLFEMIDRALDLCRPSSEKISGLELFCADGFFGNYAASRGATSLLGVDLSKKHLRRATLAAKLLGLADVARFEMRDVFDIAGEFDFAICAGGLYHLSNPEALLRKLAGQVQRALVIQTVYSLARSEPDYFEAPAPGWTWGCRFSRDYLLGMARDAGFHVVDWTTNELEGNTRPEDRGSIYVLCEPGPRTP
jgi:SAM-dependent methyltransferase